MKRTLLAVTIALASTPVLAADASVSASASYKSEKEIAAGAAASMRDHAMHAGMGAMVEGKSMKESAKAAGEAAKADGMAKAEAAKEKAAEKYGMATAKVDGYKQDAAMAISIKDRAALAKHYAAGNATSAMFNRMMGGSSTSVELKLGAKLDTTGATAVDSTVMTKLSKQPANTALYKVGNQIVRVNTKTNVIVDIAAISPK